MASPAQESERLQDALSGLCGQYNLIAIYAFGSRAAEIAARVLGQETRMEHPTSDVDISVLPLREHPLSLPDQIHLAMALEDLLSVSRVDLIVLRDADPFLAANIVRGERLHTVDEYRADEYDLYVLRQAGDLAPLERERMAIILGEMP